ncbi:MAG: rRNA maturation RNase YbeY [Actinomycetota bacterium]
MTDAVPLPTVLISDRQDRSIDTEPLVELAQRCLVGEGLGAAELSVSFVGSEEIAELHRRYMDEPGPTDVLSFAQDADTATEDGRRVLGDVVIAPSVAAANNPQDPDAEVRLLLAHGILHLLGYDHEGDDERAEMWARQERYSGVQVP